MEDKVLIFSKEEFMVLAAASGIRQMYGFSIDAGMDDQTAVLVMQELAGKGLLLSIEGMFQIQEPAASLFSQIKEAKTVIDVHKRSGKKCIVYIGDFGVKVSVCERREGMLKVQKLPLGEIWEHLTEEGWIPEKKGELG